MPPRKLQYLEAFVYCLAVAVLCIGILIVDTRPLDGAAMLLAATCLVGSGMAVNHADKQVRAAWREAHSQPLWVKVHNSPLLSTFYCQECLTGRAWWHCCRHELNLCYLCLLAHDAPPECYYIPAHRATPAADFHLRYSMHFDSPEEP